MTSPDPRTATPPHVMAVTAHAPRCRTLADALPHARILHVTDVESLLREAHATIPDVVLLYSDTPGVPLHDILPLLRQRDELAATRWLAVGTHGLGELLAAGADALVSDATPPEGLALQIEIMLGRVQQHRAAHERLGTLQRRMDTWEHEERVRDQLVHMLVHDLKNPIAAVMGLLDIVLEDRRIPRDTQDLIKVARDESQHLLHLASNMLDVRKIQAGKMHLRRELIFSPMFEEIITLAQSDVGSGLRDRHLIVDVTPSLSPVSADPEILRRIMANLISNALKHTSAGGQIAVAVRAHPGGVEISVQDNGEGIPAEDIPNLFAAFEQSRLTLHGRFDTGMGLAFCKMAVEEHGGQIGVTSERGAGSVFTLTLPLTPDTEDEDEEDFADLLV